MKNYIYRVYFNLKDNNKTRMIIDVYANSKADAKREAQKIWYTDHNRYLLNHKMSKIDPHYMGVSFNGCYYPDGNPSIKPLDFPNGTKWYW